jgi:hypothetical protein
MGYIKNPAPREKSIYACSKRRFFKHSLDLCQRKMTQNIFILNKIYTFRF